MKVFKTSIEILYNNGYILYEEAAFIKIINIILNNMFIDTTTIKDSYFSFSTQKNILNEESHTSIIDFKYTSCEYNIKSILLFYFTLLTLFLLNSLIGKILDILNTNRA